jgi:hypothetical protein
VTKPLGSPNPPQGGGRAAERLREQLARELGEVPAENPPDGSASAVSEDDASQADEVGIDTASDNASEEQDPPSDESM